MALQEELIAALDADRVVTGADELRRHGTDEGWHSAAAPDLVVYPRDTEEAAAVVRLCAQHETPIVPFGAGTSLEGHVAALEGGVSIDTALMNRILRLSVEDMDVTVQAGVTRRQLDEKLRPEGVFFSVDPGADASIGGMAATGASGTTSVRYGTMRENVLSLTVVTAAGEIVRTRSRARKSSAGYDLTRLFVGSEGTLGLITEITLRLQPTPEAMIAATAAFGSLDAAVDTVIEVLAHAIPIARMEIADDVQIDAVNQHFGLELEVAPTLFLEFHGTPAETEGAGRGDRARSPRPMACTASPGPPTRPSAARCGTPATAPTRPAARCGPAARASPPTPASRSPGSPRRSPRPRRDLDASGLIAPIVGHVGDGNFHLAILVDPDDPDEMKRAVELNDRLVRRAIANDGTCTGEHGVGYGKSAFLELEHGAVAVGMMRSIKAALDPNGLFNPGKVAGRIQE